MSCTQETYATLTAARQAIATGTNVVSVTIDGETTEYGRGNLGLLSSLIARCEAQLGFIDADDDGYFTLPTSKGFGL